MADNLTQVSSSVIKSNNIIERHIDDAQVTTRHLSVQSVTLEKLATSANFAIGVDLVQSNLTSLIVDDEFLQNTKTFVDVIVNNNFAVGTGPILWADETDESVGIGTNTPNTALHIQGGIIANNILIPTPSAPNSWIGMFPEVKGSVIIVQEGSTLRTNLRIHSNTVTFQTGNNPQAAFSNVFIAERGNLYVGHGSPFKSQHQFGVLGKSQFIGEMELFSDGDPDTGLIVMNSAVADTRYIAKINNVQSNLTGVISGATQFTANKTFIREVLIEGNLTVLGSTDSASSQSLEITDAVIIVNVGGTDETAEGAGIAIEGTGASNIANIKYAVASSSNFRMGTGTLTSADDVARTQDYQANDFITFLDAQSNDGSTLLTARSNDFVTWEAAKSNDFTTIQTARANDFTTFDTLSANDFTTWNLLNANINSVQSNVVSVSANVDTVSSNTDAKLPLAGGTLTGFVTLHSDPTTDLHIASKVYVDNTATLGLTAFNNTNTSSGTSNVFWIGSTTVAASQDRVSVYLEGIKQPKEEWQFNSGNNTVQFRDAAIVGDLIVDITAWHSA